MKKKTLIWYSIGLVLASSLLTMLMLHSVGSNAFGQKIEQAYAILNEFYYEEIDKNAVQEGMIRGLAEGVGDPYTTYMSTEEYGDFKEYITGTYSGVGVVMGSNETDDYITVVSSIDDTPAQAVGLMTGDKIIAVNGEPITANRIDEATKKIKGPADTKVVLTVLKAEAKTPVDIELVRKSITLATVKSEMKTDKTGYIRVSSFEDATANDFKTHLSELTRNGAEKLIIDLRDNPGGLVAAAVEIADIFISNDTIVYIENKNGEREYEVASHEAFDIPIVVLVNEGSASASEILTGALKDYKRATIVGEKTFGKGVIQGLYELGDGSVLKITTARYFTPNGVDINKVGIEPDVSIEGSDEQLKKALELL